MTSVADRILAQIRADIDTPRKPKTKTKTKKQTPQAANLPGEQWKKIPEYDHYEISNMGRIASNVWGYRHILATHAIIPDGGTVPHLKVTLCKNTRQRLHQIHNLVAQAFIEKPTSDQKLRVWHKDLNNENNRADNLEWVTLHESRLRAFTEYPRKDVHIHDGLPAQRNSKRLGGNRSLVSNRMTKNGWCLECASTIPVQKHRKNMQTCPHINKEIQ